MDDFILSESFIYVLALFNKRYLFGYDNNKCRILTTPINKIIVYIMLFFFPLTIWFAMVMLGNKWADLIYNERGKNMFTEYGNLVKPPFQPDYRILHGIIYPFILTFLGLCDLIIIFASTTTNNISPGSVVGYFFHFIFIILIYPYFWGLGSITSTVVVFTSGVVLILFVAIPFYNMSIIIMIIILVEFLMTTIESVYFLELGALNQSIWAVQ